MYFAQLLFERTIIVYKVEYCVLVVLNIAKINVKQKTDHDFGMRFTTKFYCLILAQLRTFVHKSIYVQHSTNTIELVFTNIHITFCLFSFFVELYCVRTFFQSRLHLYSYETHSNICFPCVIYQ